MQNVLNHAQSLKNTFRKNLYFFMNNKNLSLIINVSVCYLCACAFYTYVRNLTKQIFLIGLSARKTLALRGKVYNLFSNYLFLKIFPENSYSLVIGRQK